MSGIETHTVIIKPSEWRFEAASDMTLVQAAKQAGIRLPSSCRNGTCRACMCRLDSGQIGYPDARPGLSSDEKQEGWILPCVAHALGPLVLIVPHARPLQQRSPVSDTLTGARR